MKTTEDKIKRIISEQLGSPLLNIKSDSTFLDDLGADSLDVIELIMAFEDEFKIEIPDIDTEKILNVKDAIAYIEEKTK